MNTTTTVVSNSIKPLVMHWKAVTAGLVVAIFVGMLLNLLGVGLGFIALPLHKTGLTALGIGAVVCYILSGSLAMCLGGWTAGFFSHTCKKRESYLYGVITWALATLVGALLSAWSVGPLVGGVGSVAATSLKAVSSESVELVGKPALQLACRK
jgi:hypothetical protein